MPYAHPLDALAAELPGRAGVLLRAFISVPVMTLGEMQALSVPGEDKVISRNAVHTALFALRETLRGSGYRIDTLAGGRYMLARGVAHLAARPAAVPTGDASGLKHPEYSKPKPEGPKPESPARIIAGRREIRIPELAEQRCAYMVVETGRARPCGAPADGVYCAAHRAASAGLTGARR